MTVPPPGRLGQVFQVHAVLVEPLSGAGERLRAPQRHRDAGGAHGHGHAADGGIPTRVPAAAVRAIRRDPRVGARDGAAGVDRAGRHVVRATRRDHGDGDSGEERGAGLPARCSGTASPRARPVQRAFHGWKTSTFRGLREDADRVTCQPSRPEADGVLTRGGPGPEYSMQKHMYPQTMT